MADLATAPTAAKAQFVHLKVHSSYSLLEGALPVEKLAKLAGADGQVAMALTDSGNLFGALEFSEKLSGSGIQPIIGCSLLIDFEEKAKGPESLSADRNEAKLATGRLAFLAKDEAGYANLMLLTSTAYLDTPDGDDPRVLMSVLEKHAEGLIALSGGPDGGIDRMIAAGKSVIARKRLERLRAAFGDRLYVELQRHGEEREQAVEPELIGMAYDLDLPIVAANEPYFPAASDYDAHDALICIAAGAYISEDDRRRLTREHYFKSQSEMAKLFADLPEAISATVEIAERCAFRPRTRKPILPQFVQTPSGSSTEAQLAAEGAELRRQAEEGLERRLETAGPAPGETADSYRERLAFELDVITRMTYQGYFLIVADFIKWAKAQGIPVGPGRGSGAGSVVAWALTITDLDPMRFGLLFERFLNPERVSMPDFDIDFCQDRRDEVIRYVEEKYGKGRVAQIITYGKLQARAVLRDVGRVLQMPYGQVDRLCKLVPNNPANPVTLEQAMEIEPKINEEADADPLVAKLLEIGKKLEGLYRHASTHAAGVVIGDRPLQQLVPLYRDPRSSLPATQFNMKWVEAAGLVKFDFLGLKTLTVLQKACAFLAKRGVDLDLMQLGLDDTPTYAMLARGEATGVFQLESTGMRDSLRKLKPDRFGDIIAMVALYRPGPMDNIPTYIARKAGQEQVDYLHPLLKPILDETYGVIIYQEQVMQIAQVLSGYSLGEADLLRRAMGKKNKEEMAAQKTRFVEGAVKNWVDAGQASDIFEKVDKFAGYGFNKSHAAAYALLAYHTAYLKANHPVEFIAASMTYDMANADKLQLFVEEARRTKIPVLRPSINASAVDFLPEKGGIRYSLAALKNVGRGVVETLMAERETNGRFTDLTNFARRADPRAVNKRTLETLISAGALDDVEEQRALSFVNVEAILAMAGRTASDRAAGQNDLFGTGGAAVKPEALQLKPARSWPAMDRLAKEFEAIGQYLTGHPLDEYQGAMKKMPVQRFRDFEQKALTGQRQGLIAGILVTKRERRSKSGNRFAFISLSDQTGQFEAIVFSDLLNEVDDLLEVGKPLLVNVAADVEGDTVKLRAEMIQSLEKASLTGARGIRVHADTTLPWAELSVMLEKPGKSAVHVLVRLPDSGPEVEIKIDGGRDLPPALLSRLRTLPGVESVQEL